MKYIFIGLLIIACSCAKNNQDQAKEEYQKNIEDYIQKFPYQETYDYMMKYTGGDPSRLNNPVDLKPELLKAGEDKVVRSNNDTYYSGGFLYLEEGPVKLSASYADPNRFYSFQLMDDKNCNFHNIIRPEGNYYIYYEKKPTDITDGELIQSPSLLVGVITRVEVKDKNDSTDVETATKVYNGLDISGPAIKEFPKLDLLSSFPDAVANRALEMMDSVFAIKPFNEIVASEDMIPDQVSYLDHAAATKNGWGGPVAEHSTYDIIFFDDNGKELFGNKGTYKLTTEEPDVDAFWSVTAYDTEIGGHFHANQADRYHINNTSAVRNTDGTITFTFKTTCEEGDLNCIEVPDGQFDLIARYYLPGENLISGDWKINRPRLTQD